jgi:hypothetical protein
VQAYAYFPYAVAHGIDDFRGGEISFRFKPVAGRIDQGAGILFNLMPNGDYLLVRANALENNLVLFKYEKGKRSSVEWIIRAGSARGQWCKSTCRERVPPRWRPLRKRCRRLPTSAGARILVVDDDAIGALCDRRVPTGNRALRRKSRSS